jgi:hypothetical protein
MVRTIVATRFIHQGGQYMIVRKVLAVTTALAATVSAASLSASSFVFSAGSADRRLASLSQPVSSSTLETETADDFILTETTSIKQAILIGLLPPDTPLSSVTDVEIEFYRVFPNDSATPSGNVPTRNNSPADVEISGATRDSSRGTLAFSAAVLTSTFTAQNSVVTGINKAPANVTHGEGPVTGEEVQITVTFDPPVVLPSDHYFFRPEVSVAAGNFLYLSAPRPIVSGTPFLPDLQAWIRNADLKPDWLRIGTDIIDGVSPPTFNMAFSLNGETIPDAGTPGQSHCHGDTVAALARQFGGLHTAASALGFSGVATLQDGLRTFCAR